MKTWIWVLIGLVIGILVTGFLISNSDNTVQFPKSEYTKCIEASQDRSCEIAILEKDGYVDGVDCIMDSDNPICDFDRYNAEVDASNECFGNKPNLIDCAELIK